ncbi:MAG: sugar phosphate nucleotidyltransferase [Syntrophobacteraceae bacterium]
MRAMILAAGLGTRLRPLTLVRPKVLAPVFGIAVLDYWVWRLFREGASEVILNSFHLGNNLASIVSAKKWPVPVTVVTEPVLLGTGGGIRNVLDFFDKKPFAVVNGDVISDLPLKELYMRHLGSGNSASLVLHDCPEFNNVAVDREGFIKGFGEEAIGLAVKHSEMRLMAFTGIHFLDPAILQDITPGTPADILTTYRELIKEKRYPKALLEADFLWREIGSLDSYRSLHEELSQFDENRLSPIPTGKKIWAHPTAQIASDAVLKGFVAVGEKCRIMQGVEMENTIIWDDVRVERNSRLRNCIITDGVVVQGDHENETLTGIAK